MNNIHGIIFAYSSHDRLKELTEQRTVASLSFGGRYRIVDFALSNLIAAGITTVGVVMQENYQSLIDHIGSGKDWDLNRKIGGLRLLPPFGLSGRSSANRQFQGWMDALASVERYLTNIREDFVLLCNADLVANLPLSDFAQRHIASGADVSVLCTSNDVCESEFNSTVAVDEQGSVTDIAYGCKLPGGKNSLDVYILRTDLLIKMVQTCRSHHYSRFDVDILLKQLKQLDVRAVEFDGFARRILSTSAYFEASLALLDRDVRRSLFGTGRPVRCRIRDEAPTYYAPESEVSNCLIANACRISGKVENCIISPEVTIAPGAHISDAVVLRATSFGEGSRVSCAIIDKFCSIGPSRTLVGSRAYPIVVPKGSTL